MFKRSWAGIFFSAGMTAIEALVAHGRRAGAGRRTTTSSHAAAPRRRGGRHPGARASAALARHAVAGRVRPVHAERCCTGVHRGRDHGQGHRSRRVDLLRVGLAGRGDRQDHPADDAGAGRAGHAVRPRPVRRDRAADRRGRRQGQDGLVRGRPRRRQPRHRSCAARSPTGSTSTCAAQRQPTPAPASSTRCRARSARSGTPSVRTVIAPTYPGLASGSTDRAQAADGERPRAGRGEPARAATRRRSATCRASVRRCRGRRRSAVTAVASTCPARPPVFSLGRTRLQLLLIAGRPRSGCGSRRGDQNSGEAILFAKLYDVSAGRHPRRCRARPSRRSACALPPTVPPPR